MILTTVVTFEEDGLMDLGDYIASNFDELCYSTATISNGVCQIVLSFADLQGELQEEAKIYLQGTVDLSSYLQEQEYFIHLATFVASSSEEEPQKKEPHLKLVH